jgi:hypothetical protein
MTEIIITLVAVVLLILVIGFFAMRFLRADDSDPFEDAPDERGPARSGDAHGSRSDDRVVPLASRSGRGSRSATSDDRPTRGREVRARAGASYDEAPHDQPPYAAGGGQARRGATERGTAQRGSTQRGSTERGSTQRRGTERAGRGGQRPAASERPAASDRSAPGGERPDSERTPARRPAAARSGRGKNAADPAGPDWDSMSDIDYWAELTSDKPLTTTAQPAAQSAGAQSTAQPAGQPPAAAAQLPRREQDSQPDPSARPGRAGRADARADESTALLPVRRRPAPAGDSPRAADAGRPGRGGQPGLPARVAAQDPAGRPGFRRGRGGFPDGRGGPDPATPDQGMAALVRLGNGGGTGSRPVPLDDDPLTSPSFPAIRASDSRSYRRPEAAGHTAPRPAADGRPVADTRPAADVRSGYGSQPPAGRPAERAPGYGQPSGSPDRGARTPPGGPAGYPAYAQESAQPAGNPYGSYVSDPADNYPQPAAVGYYPASPDTRQYGEPPARQLAAEAQRPEPVYAAPVYETPAYETPVYETPAYEAPAYEAPAYETPAYEAPVNQAPRYEAQPHEAPVHRAAPHQPHLYSVPPAQAAPATQPSPTAHGAPAAGYGESWYGAPASGQTGEASYDSGGPGYPAAAYGTEHYDQPAYLSTDIPGLPQDQRGYGTPDSGYGAEAYGGYPSY